MAGELPDAQPKPLISVAEAARRLGISESAAYRLAAAGALPGPGQAAGRPDAGPRPRPRGLAGRAGAPAWADGRRTPGAPQTRTRATPSPAAERRAQARRQRARLIGRRRRAAATPTRRSLRAGGEHGESGTGARLDCNRAAGGAAPASRPGGPARRRRARQAGASPAASRPGTRKRADGEGTICDDAKADLWRGAVMVGRSRTAGPTSGRSTARPRRRAVRKLEALKAQAARAACWTTPSPSAGLLAQWLADCTVRGLRPRSLAGYTQCARLYLAPAIGRIKVQALKPEHVRTTLADLTRQGIAPATVRKVRVVLHAALQLALRAEIVGRNVADAVKPPGWPGRSSTRPPRRRRCGSSTPSRPRTTPCRRSSRSPCTPAAAPASCWP